jgi:hypothetical protein
MNLEETLASLKAECEQLNQAIVSLELLVEGRAWKRRNAQKDSERDDPPLEDAAVPVRAPRPRPNLPPATAAADLPSPELTLGCISKGSESLIG